MEKLIILIEKLELIHILTEKDQSLLFRELNEILINCKKEECEIILFKNIFSLLILFFSNSPYFIVFEEVCKCLISFLENPYFPSELLFSDSYFINSLFQSTIILNIKKEDQSSIIFLENNNHISDSIFENLFKLINILFNRFPNLV